MFRSRAVRAVRAAVRGHRVVHLAVCKSAAFGVFVAYIFVAGAGVFLHWHAATQKTPFAAAFKEWYLQPDPEIDRKYHAAATDYILPAIILGLVAGILTADKSEKYLGWCVFLLAAGIVGLFPYYASVLPINGSQTWWTSMPSGIKWGFLFIAYWKTTLLCIAFGLFGRGLPGLRQNSPANLST